MILVRQIESPKDGVDVEILAQQHHDEYGTSREFEAKAVGRAAFRCCMDKSRKYLNCWVAYDDNNKPVGYLAGTLRDSFYSDRFYAVQEMWYVVPQYRGTRTAIELLVQFERWAIQRNAERIYVQVEHDADDELVERIFNLMQRLGYKKQGYIGVKVPIHTHTNTEELNNDRTTHREVGAGQSTASV